MGSAPGTTDDGNSNLPTVFAIVVVVTLLAAFLVRAKRGAAQKAAVSARGRTSGGGGGGNAAVSADTRPWVSSSVATRKLVLVASTPLASNVLQLTFKPATPSDRVQLGPGRHLYVFFPHGDAEHKRPYSPVRCEADRVDLVVKVYADGIGSNYLRRLKSGDTITVKGPTGKFDFAPVLERKVQQIGMLAGGTGITPIYQLLRHIYDTKEIMPKPRVHVLFSNRTAEDVLLREELEALAKTHPELTIEFHLSGVSGRCCGVVLSRHFDFMLKTGGLFVMCGPPAFQSTFQGLLLDSGWSTSSDSHRLFVF